MLADLSRKREPQLWSEIQNHKDHPSQCERSSSFSWAGVSSAPLGLTGLLLRSPSFPTIEPATIAGFIRFSHEIGRLLPSRSSEHGTVKSLAVQLGSRIRFIPKKLGSFLDIKN